VLIFCAAYSYIDGGGSIAYTVTLPINAKAPHLRI